MALSPCEVRVNDEGREVKQHGTALFPVACYEDDLTHLSVPWHWHEELEAIVVTQGSAIFACDSERFELEAGEGCFINSNVIHAVWNTGESSCLLHSVVFHPRLVGGSPESVFWHNYVLPIVEDSALRMKPLSAQDDSTMLNAIESAWQACAQEPPAFELTVRDALSQLLVPLVQQTRQQGFAPTTAEQRQSNRLKTMLTYMREHLDVDISVADIARSASVSESECLRCFRASLGTSPMRYLRQLRLSKAESLLRDTNESIARIGEQCGFLEKSYFTRRFKEQYYMTPSEFRKSFQVSYEE